jgi:nucleolar protein 56|tara:strand:- start:35 stop:1069 length:1035 start_codon:yes stop_codon:yes gene_type:complete
LKPDVDSEGIVKLHYDWRMARVIDDDGVVIDEVIWTSKRSAGAVADRLFDLQRGRLSPEARVLAERFPEALVDAMGALSDSNWLPLNDEEVKIFEAAAPILAKRGVADAAGDVDRRLDMLVSSAAELRSSWTTNESRCVEWVGLFLSEVDLDAQRNEIPTAIAEADSIESAASSLRVTPPVHSPSDVEWQAIREHAKGVVELTERLSSHEDAIRDIAQQHVPSLSALIGPLGAARLVTLAGGRERLARMPSGSLQVLGAHAAMAAHRRGAPPPKHGAILFSMPQISKSPRWVRGKIARFLAGKASIAVRCDHFGGEAWGEEKVSAIHRETEAIKAKFPKPPKRR